LIKFNLKFGAEASAEIEESYIWYEEQKDGLGELFLQHLDYALKNIQKNPDAFLRIANHRQYHMDNFPFVILYEKIGRTIYIDAVFHTSRNPDKKKDR
jgi:hypothetical protein